MLRIFTIAATVMLTACADHAAADKADGPVSLVSVLMDTSEGCMKGPTEQFGRYIGDWDIRDWSLSREEAKTWTEQKGARWNFTCVGNGIAVQDFWMPNGGGTGTNLRIYNPETESWDIVWTATGAPGTMQIDAKEDENGDIVMNILSPEQNPPRRIVFYKPSADSWDWAMQVSQDKGETWHSVYKIEATRRQ